jgi:hypothetical protein
VDAGDGRRGCPATRLVAGGVVMRVLPPRGAADPAPVSVGARDALVLASVVGVEVAVDVRPGLALDDPELGLLLACGRGPAGSASAFDAFDAFEGAEDVEGAEGEGSSRARGSARGSSEDVEGVGGSPSTPWKASPSSAPSGSGSSHAQPPVIDVFVRRRRAAFAPLVAATPKPRDRIRFSATDASTGPAARISSSVLAASPERGPALSIVSMDVDASPSHSIPDTDPASHPGGTRSTTRYRSARRAARS